jgi:NhaA family Na+:H+ antiporter
MATDIAFCIGVLTLLRTRVPRALAVFVTALAIFDDIGGILVIAFFYGHGLAAGWLAGALAVTMALIAIGRAHVRSGLAYAAGGALLWLALHHGGIHATIVGVVLGLVIPARPPRAASDALGALAAHAQALLRSRRDEAFDGESLGAIEERLAELKAPLTRFVEALHPWVAFGVMPTFALANSGVDLRGLDAAQMVGPVAVGTAVALVAGKLVGISVFTWAAVKVGIAPMPGSAPLSKLLGVSAVAGIGFTVALFIAGLAFPATPSCWTRPRLASCPDRWSPVARERSCYVSRAPSRRPRRPGKACREARRRADGATGFRAFRSGAMGCRARSP